VVTFTAFSGEHTVSAQKLTLVDALGYSRSLFMDIEPCRTAPGTELAQGGVTPATPLCFEAGGDQALKMKLSWLPTGWNPNQALTITL
jgi:hypothetical protein